MRFVPTHRRLRAAGGPGEQKRPPGHCRPVRLGAPCCIATHGELWARECARSGPWSSESVGVGLRGVIFFINTRVHVHKKGIISSARAEPALAKRVSWQGGAREKNAIFLRNSTLLYSLLKSRRFSKPTKDTKSGDSGGGCPSLTCAQFSRARANSKAVVTS